MWILRSNRITLRLVFLISFSAVFVHSVDLLCNEGEHFCEATLKCISKSYLCDGDNDCGDFSDENEERCKLEAHTLPLVANELTSTCEPGQFACFEKCINENWVCDGDPDCDNGEDEDIRFCFRITRSFYRTPQSTTPKAPCLSSQFDCGEKCIRLTWLCDGDRDCDDGNDEAGSLCSSGEARPTTTTRLSMTVRLSTTTRRSTTPKAPCLSSEFDCGEKCIRLTWLCDGDRDCDDGNDEAGSLCSSGEARPTTTTRLSTPSSSELPCFPDLFDCGGQCISRIYVCNGYFDCPNGHDEMWPTCLGSGEEPPTILPTTMNNYESRMREIQTPPRNTTADQLSTTTPKSSDVDEDNNSSKGTASLFIWLNWKECLFIVLGLLVIVIVTTFICIKRRKHSTNLNSQGGENRTPAVSYLNSSTTPNCQLVFVSSAVRLEPALIQPTTDDTHLGQPPPYDTMPSTLQPSPSNQQQQNFTKGHECLV